MKKFGAIYYLLFVLMVFGAFASMAQNDYGLPILGLVAIAFATIFLIQLLVHLSKKENSEIIETVELISLVLLSSILSMRVFYLRFPFVEIVFGLAGLMLIASYLIKLLNSFTILQPKNKVLSYLVALFYGSIVFYILSMTIVPFTPKLAEPAGGIAFGLLIGFLVIGYWMKGLMLEGEKISAIEFVIRLKDRSIVLISLFLLFTAYMGLTKINVLPRMYSDEFPQSYFELVNQAESGNEKPVDGKYKHEEFKELYDRFVNRHIDSESK